MDFYVAVGFEVHAADAHEVGEVGGVEFGEGAGRVGHGESGVEGVFYAAGFLRVFQCEEGFVAGFHDGAELGVAGDAEAVDELFGVDAEVAFGFGFVQRAPCFVGGVGHDRGEEAGEPVYQIPHGGLDSAAARRVWAVAVEAVFGGGEVDGGHLVVAEVEEGGGGGAEVVVDVGLAHGDGELVELGEGPGVERGAGSRTAGRTCLAGGCFAGG